MATNDNVTATTPRTAIRETILAGMSGGLEDDAVQALEDMCLSATEAACWNRYPLLDFDEYASVYLV
jgi:hypothetical protein